jgi:hypothetical protein
MQNFSTKSHTTPLLMHTMVFEQCQATLLGQKKDKTREIAEPKLLDNKWWLIN